MTPDDEKEILNVSQNVTRRTLIASATFLPTLIPLSALTARAQPAAPVAGALSEPEKRILEAFVDRLVPKDEHGPGAVECGAANYIDQQLAGALAAERANFASGLAAIDAFSQRTQNSAFAELSAEKRDAVLTAMDSGSAAGFANARAVFSRIRRLTLEGMFSDPHYGGNTGFAGWDLIRYPGPRIAVAPAEQSMTGEIKPYRKSAWPQSSGQTSGGGNAH
jgi:gluconate 2-dehydrogenase gamma chain